MENVQRGERRESRMRRAWRRAWREWARMGRAASDPRSPQPGARSPFQGMTLIEIMVVIAIIGLIMGAVAFLVIPRFQQSKEKVAAILVQKVYNAAAEYYTIAPPGGG